MLPVILILSAVALLVVFIILRVKSRKKKQLKKEMEQLAGERLRTEALDRMILNEKAQNDVIKGIKAYSEQPYQTRFSSTANAGYSKPNMSPGRKLMLQVEETGLYSKRSYMLDPEQLISIGSGTGNTIALPGMDIDQTQCEVGTFSADKGSVYARNTGRQDRVILLRKRSSTYLGAGYAQIMDGDVLQIAEVSLKFNFIRLN